MPVVFLCQNCRSRLKVGRKKIGTEVECPRCRVPLRVPAAETASAMMTIAQTEPPKLSHDLFPEFAVFDDPSPPPVPSGPAASAPPPPPPPSKKSKHDASHSAAAPARSPPRAPALLSEKPVRRPRSTAGGHALGVVKRDDQPSSYSDVLLIRRRTLYFQAALILLMATVGLVLGFLIGRGIGPPDRGVTGGDSDVQVAGTLTFRNARGEETPDFGAVVIALPAEIPANKLGSLLVTGLGPQTPRDGGRVAEMAIEELGGKYDRTDALGNFVLKLPKPGSYRLLFVSRGAQRPAGEVVTPAQLKEMQRYFNAPADLIGRNKYVWALREVRDPRLAVLHTF